jgi:hypothetical protein
MMSFYGLILIVALLITSVYVSGFLWELSSIASISGSCTAMSETILRSAVIRVAV